MTALPDSVTEERWTGKKIHFLGIGGIGTSAIARLLQRQGCVVSGCDTSQSELTRSLAAEGVRVSVGHSPSHIEAGTDIVIISAAVRDTNPELREARRRRVPVLKYAQALGCMMNGRAGIAVSGSHGKTTTTSMVAYALDCAGRHPSMVVGGMVPQLGGNSRDGGDGPFVVEACEYDRSFLNLSPRAAIINNIDRDHLDYYGGLGELVEAFGCFAARVSGDGLLVVNGDDPNALEAAQRASARVETFGQKSGCNWRVAEWSRADGRSWFRVIHDGRDAGTFELLVPGLHNICNALAATAICHYFGVELKDVRGALARFTGATRRFDRLGESGGVIVLDDYGHHPTEIRVTLDAARREFPDRRLWCVFQPHQCSRTRLLMDEFAHSFNCADRVIVPDIHSVRDSEADRHSVHARDLVEQLRLNGVDAEYGSRFPQTVRRLLSDVRSGDLVMTMGAGPVDSVGRELLKELQRRERADGLAMQS